MPIEFFEDDTFSPTTDGVVFNVPNGLNEKRAIFDAFGAGLVAPNGYFGENWDAFNDCLMDMQWIAQSEIVIVHHQLPKLSENELLIYLKTLITASSEWGSEKTQELAEQFDDFVPHRLKVCFHVRAKATVLSVLST